MAGCSGKRSGRLERLLSQPGSALWSEMKQNAAAMTAGAEAGLAVLYEHLAGSQAPPCPLRLHFAGHSAGSIAAAQAAEFLCRRGVGIDSVSFLAPAIRVDEFHRLLAPRLADGSVSRYQQFHLTDKAEEDDPTCGPYRRSLLWLVSQSFEGGVRTPILGIKRYFDADAAMPAGVAAYVAPGKTSASTTHGGFYDDEATLAQVVVLKTADGVSRSISTGQVVGSLLGFTLFYGSLGILDVYLLTKFAKKGPDGDIGGVHQDGRKEGMTWNSN